MVVDLLAKKSASAFMRKTTSFEVIARYTRECSDLDDPDRATDVRMSDECTIVKAVKYI